MLRRRLHLGAIAAFCALALAPLAAAAPSQAERLAARTIAVSFEPSVSAERRAELLARAGATPVRRIAPLGYVVARVAPERRAGAIAFLRGSGATRVVHASHVFRTSAAPVLPNDPAYPLSTWPYTQLGLPDAWASTQGAGSVVIAVIDTGVFPGSSDLSGRLVPGYNALAPGAPPDDDNGHGTLVATTAAGALNNLFGGAGACPLCSIMPVKVMNNAGRGADVDIATGVTWAADNGADIINLSLGDASDDPVLGSAIAYAQSRNVLVVAAAGNDGGTDPEYPAAYDGVLSVGASDASGQLMGFSQHGAWVDVAAPGCVEAADLTDSLAYACGTSFATPLTAGVAGLLLASNPALTRSELEARIEASAIATGADVRSGVVAASNLFEAPTPPSVPRIASLPLRQPSIVGSALPGARLSAKPGSVGALGITVGYLWQVRRRGAWRPVPRATARVFDVPRSIAGLKVRVLVTARNASGAVQQQAASHPVTVRAPRILKLKP